MFDTRAYHDVRVSLKKSNYSQPSRLQADRELSNKRKSVAFRLLYLLSIAFKLLKKVNRRTGKVDLAMKQGGYSFHQ